MVIKSSLVIFLTMCRRGKKKLYWFPAEVQMSFLFNYRPEGAPLYVIWVVQTTLQNLLLVLSIATTLCKKPKNFTWWLACGCFVMTLFLLVFFWFFLRGVRICATLTLLSKHVFLNVGFFFRFHVTTTICIILVYDFHNYDLFVSSA